MGIWLPWFRPRKARTARVPVRRFTTTSRPVEPSPLRQSFGEFLDLPNATPFFMLGVYRFLRDSIPDVSDGIWTWKRLCQSGFDVEIHGASSDVARHRAERLIAELNAKVNGGDRGMDGLLDVFYTSLFTYGAAALEIVLTPSREQIADVVPVDVWTVRFKREAGRLQAYQVLDGETIKLPMERFIYVGLDRDGTNPYGQSMLRSIPFVVKVQQRLIEDMAKATHNAGWPRLHIRYMPEERARGESEEAYDARVQGTLAALQDSLQGTETDQNLVTNENVEVSVLEGARSNRIFYENHKAIEEQVITGLHLMPILLGRNYGTTETYGTAQFEIINRHCRSVNRQVKRILERLYNFELALMWGEARAKVRMRENRTVNVLDEANARKVEIENALRLRDEGLVSREQVARMLGVE